MSGIENIVRPWQTANYEPARQYFNAGQPGVPSLIIRAGRSGQGKTFNGSFSASQTNYMTQYDNEKKNANFGTVF